MLSKSLEFKNIVNQRIKVIEIPVNEEDHHDWVIQAHLQILLHSLYNNPQEKSIFSFRDYLKRKMKWSDFKELYGIREFKNNA